jgi:predicted RNA binding protein YcfA (HicA-like mRNA interferase family)
MKLPRDIDGPRLIKAPEVLGYQATRQKGSHVRITTQRAGENYEVIPFHHPINPGTLSSILNLLEL